MNKQKIIVKPESANLWWGIYGFCEKVGWEDLNLFYENEERIGGVCLNTKAYLRNAIPDLKKDPEEVFFLNAIENYLLDDKCHYWYYYDIDREDEAFYEVPYKAPKNEKGIKPRFMDIWHPDEGISLSTIESAVNDFIQKHLDIDEYEIEIQNIVSLEESFESFKENEDLFGGETPVGITFTDELIEELSNEWK